MDRHFEIYTVIRLGVIALTGAALSLFPVHVENFAGRRLVLIVSVRMLIIGLVSTYISLQIDNQIAAQISFALGLFGVDLVRRERGRARGLTVSSLWMTGATLVAMILGFNLAKFFFDSILAAMYSAHHLPGWFN